MIDEWFHHNFYEHIIIMIPDQGDSSQGSFPGFPWGRARDGWNINLVILQIQKFLYMFLCHSFSILKLKLNKLQTGIHFICNECFCFA